MILVTTCVQHCKGVETMEIVNLGSNRVIEYQLRVQALIQQMKKLKVTE